jgi:hypothetical protein
MKLCRRSQSCDGALALARHASSTTVRAVDLPPSVPPRGPRPLASHCTAKPHYAYALLQAVTRSASAFQQHLPGSKRCSSRPQRPARSRLQLPAIKSAPKRARAHALTLAALPAMPGVSNQGLAVAAAASAALYGYWAYLHRRGIVADPSRNVANADVPRPGRGDMYDRATVDTFPPGEWGVGGGGRGWRRAGYAVSALWTSTRAASGRSTQPPAHYPAPTPQATRTRWAAAARTRRPRRRFPATAAWSAARGRRVMRARTTCARNPHPRRRTTK